MTDTEQKILEEFAQQPSGFNIPDLSPSREDLKKGTPLIDPIPTKAVPVPVPESWGTFWMTGIPTIINSILTCFGWGLAAQRNGNGDVVNMFPIRTNSRGLGEDDVVVGLEAFSKYMAMNAQTLHEESYEAEHHIQELLYKMQQEEDENIPIFPDELTESSAGSSEQGVPVRKYGSPYEIPQVLSETSRNQQMLREKFAALGIDLNRYNPGSVNIDQLGSLGGEIVPAAEADMIPDGMELTEDLPDGI